MSDLLERFLPKYEVTDECWLWTAAIDRAGYGRIGGADGRILYAHRVAYELAVGEIPKGLVIDHLCRVRHCVNPDHLEVVSQRQNILRGTAPVVENARKTHCKWGHEFTPENTRIRLRPGDTERVCIACAKIREAKRIR